MKPGICEACAADGAGPCFVDQHHYDQGAADERARIISIIERSAVRLEQPADGFINRWISVLNARALRAVVKVLSQLGDAA